MILNHVPPTNWATRAHATREIRTLTVFHLKEAPPTNWARAALLSTGFEPALSAFCEPRLLPVGLRELMDSEGLEPPNLLRVKELLYH